MCLLKLPSSPLILLCPEGKLGELLASSALRTMSEAAPAAVLHTEGGSREVPGLFWDHSLNRAFGLFQFKVKSQLTKTQLFRTSPVGFQKKHRLKEDIFSI